MISLDNANSLFHIFLYISTYLASSLQGCFCEFNLKLVAWLDILNSKDSFGYRNRLTCKDVIMRYFQGHHILKLRRMMVKPLRCRICIAQRGASKIECKFIFILCRRHLNIRGKSANLPAITDKDWLDLKFGIDVGVDYYALSFVRNAEVIYELKRYLSHQGELPCMRICRAVCRTAQASFHMSTSIFASQPSQHANP